jgi:hypothetical protein
MMAVAAARSCGARIAPNSTKEQHMHPAIKATIGLAIGTAVVTAASTAQAADTDSITLRPVAGRYTGSPEKYVGGGSAAKAYRNDNGSYTLAKLATTETNAYAALVVDGAQGEQLAELGSFSFDVGGHAGGGSPRMNLFWDNDGDAAYDGYALVGGASAVTDGRISIDLSNVEPYAGEDPDEDATVVSLSILVDEQGTWTIDDVMLDGEALR